MQTNHEYTDHQYEAYKEIFNCSMRFYIEQVSSPSLLGFITAFWRLLVAEEVYKERVIINTWKEAAEGKNVVDEKVNVWARLRQEHRNFHARCLDSDTLHHQFNVPPEKD